MMKMKETVVVFTDHLERQHVLPGQNTSSNKEILVSKTYNQYKYEPRIRKMKINLNEWLSFKCRNIINSDMSLFLKSKIYEQCILTIMMYKFQKYLERNPTRTHQGMERKMVVVTMWNNKQARWKREQSKKEVRKWGYMQILIHINDERWIT